MDISIEYFLGLNPTKQINLIKDEKFINIPREKKVELLKSALEAGLSSKTTASVLKVLRELKYRDQFFYRKFLYHGDSSVANAARKAISESIEQRDGADVPCSDWTCMPGLLAIEREYGPRIQVWQPLTGKNVRISPNSVVNGLFLPTGEPPLRDRRAVRPMRSPVPAGARAPGSAGR